jgi:hypothetical protein
MEYLEVKEFLKKKSSLGGYSLKAVRDGDMIQTISNHLSKISSDDLKSEVAFLMDYVNFTDSLRAILIEYKSTLDEIKAENKKVLVNNYK